MDDISARLRTIMRNPKKLQMTALVSKTTTDTARDCLLTHHNSSASTGCCDCKSAISDWVSVMLCCFERGCLACLHWDEDETHHHSQTEAGDGHYMEVTLCFMSAVKNMSSAID